jgi:nucleotide-binding universal stress UspA family protein
MEIKKLLFVTKFEELGLDALQSLLTLRNASLNHVVFMYVIERDSVAMRRGTGYKKDEEIRLRETANIRFIDWAENLFEQGMEVGVYIVVGKLIPQVLKAAEKEEADLIVIGRREKGVLEMFYSGSDITELLRRSQTPVLIYKQLSASTGGNVCVLDRPFDRPLLAVDWSPASSRAVAFVKTLKNVINIMDVIHVVSEKELVTTNAMEVQITRKKTRQKLDNVCNELEGAGISAKPHVYIGNPVDEIERAARECQASLIITGSSSKSTFVERFIGSIPRAVAEKSAYPTLIIPPRMQGT